MGKPGPGQRPELRRAVFLDRDGVINRAIVRDGRPYPPDTLEELEFLPGVRDAVAALSRAGFRVIVVTNQPDVATGRQTRAVVEEMHVRIRQNLEVDDIRVCYHVDEDGCDCRKPRPGMLTTAAADGSIDLSRSFMVGDRWRDVEAGRAAGCKTILIRADYDERRALPDVVVDSLPDAVDLILTNRL